MNIIEQPTAGDLSKIELNLFRRIKVDKLRDDGLPVLSGRSGCDADVLNTPTLTIYPEIEIQASHLAFCTPPVITNERLETRRVDIVRWRIVGGLIVGVVSIHAPYKRQRVVDAGRSRKGRESCISKSHKNCTSELHMVWSFSHYRCHVLIAAAS